MYCTCALYACCSCLLDSSNFASPYWKERVCIPEPLYVQGPTHPSSNPIPSADTASASHGLLLPSKDVLVESFEGGKPMTQVLAELSERRATGREEKQYGKYYQELAAIGLDAVLKMVSAMCNRYYLRMCLLPWLRP
jgi:hypothetical protein